MKLRLTIAAAAIISATACQPETDAASLASQESALSSQGSFESEHAFDLRAGTAVDGWLSYDSENVPTDFVMDAEVVGVLGGITQIRLALRAYYDLTHQQQVGFVDMSTDGAQWVEAGPSATCTNAAGGQGRCVVRGFAATGRTGYKLSIIKEQYGWAGYVTVNDRLETRTLVGRIASENHGQQLLRPLVKASSVGDCSLTQGLTFIPQLDGTNPVHTSVKNIFGCGNSATDNIGTAWIAYQ